MVHWVYETGPGARAHHVGASRDMTSTQPPDDLPTYSLLTGPDDAAFCHRVSEMVALGYKLYGPPSVTYDGERVIAAQAVIWPTLEEQIAPTR